MKNKLTIGTRGSNLALWQTRLIEKQLSELYPQLKIEVIIIKTKGDIILDTALSKIEGKGLFTKEIEDSLIAGDIDLAVHSLKDMPTELPDGLSIGAITSRQNPADALLSKSGRTLNDLPEGATVLTSSLRRKCQVLNLRPDLQVEDIRGNIDTRIMKFQKSDATAMILAAAGLIRLELDSLISSILDPVEFLPACGQGALAIEIRSDDNDTKELIAPLADKESEITTIAERSFLKAMGGGCQVPMGAYGQVANDKIKLKAMSGDISGSNIYYAQGTEKLDNAVTLGIRLAAEIQRQEHK